MGEAFLSTVPVHVEARVNKPLLHPGWPLSVLFVAFPAWWLLGLGQFIWPVLALPMFFSLLVAGKIRFPRGFGIWLLFLGWMLASAFALGASSRLPVFIYRASVYLSATVLFLYIYNMPRQALPTRKILNVLNIFWVVVVAGGYLGMLLPSASFRSPFEILAPAGLAGNAFFYELVHLEFADINTFLGYPTPRPKAPFAYTNHWGSALALLTPLVFAGWFQSPKAARRRTVLFLFAAALVPAIVSLNRGLWLSLGLGLIYTAIRFALRARVRALAGVLVLFGVIALTLFLTPLQELVNARLATPHSNDDRSSLYYEAIDAVSESPVLGFGSPLPSSEQYQPSVGTQGQLWMVLISNGVPGAALYVGWLVYALWRTRRGESTIALWCHAVVLVGLVQILFYGHLPAQLHILMAAVALAYREALDKGGYTLDVPAAAP